MFRDAWLVAGKDLRIEARSKVVLNQIGPFSLVVLLLFAFALDPDRGFLQEATPGLFWIAVLLSTLVVIQRSYALEAVDAGRDALRLSGLDPAGVFLGKAGAAFVVLVVLEVGLVDANHLTGRRFAAGPARGQLTGALGDLAAVGTIEQDGAARRARGLEEGVRLMGLYGDHGASRAAGGCAIAAPTGGVTRTGTGTLRAGH